MSQLNRLKIQLEITGTDEDSLLTELLEVAKYAILSRRHPFGNFPTDNDGTAILEPRFFNLQIRIAVYLYNKIGAEGQIGHSENGISRSYEVGDVPESYLKEVMPLVDTLFSVGDLI